ncbi:MAG: D-alanine--D-alanine ligase [Alphaproteobacteria bacterium]|nr:D-alanine--D-alanine ligase [Alphaproteobacteria bacterium]
MSHIKNPQAQNTQRPRVAVIFGGRSPEHDVSVVTGLQVMQAVDSARYEAFPVYIDPKGAWFTGDVLRKRENYLLNPVALAQARNVTLDVNISGKGRLVPVSTPFIGRGRAVEFDIALPAFHGLYGEDGNIQGLFELAGIPYTGMRTLACALLMDKAATKRILQALDIPTLPHAILSRPKVGTLIPKDKIATVLREKNIGFPCIVKPSHLGSSIGVAKAANEEEIAACLPAVFEYDDTAIVEPFVQNLVEYNVAVSRIRGRTEISAIERPKTTDELLDFKQKYLAGGGGKKTGGVKNPGQISQGMLSLTRELNPDLDPPRQDNIRSWAHRLFEALDGTGAPRIDFIGDSKTGELWLNEVNPCPGSFGYFLWEALDNPFLFTEFLSALLEEAVAEKRRKILPADPVPRDARLFPRAV